MPAQNLGAPIFLRLQETQQTDLSTPSNMPSPTNRTPSPLQQKLERQHSWNTRTEKCVAAFKEALCASGPNQRAVPAPALKSPPEPLMEESPHPLDVGPEASIQVEVPAVNQTESTPTPSRQDEPIDSSAMDGEE